MQGTPIKRIVIVGGGTAGWMAAAALAKGLPAGQCEIILVESEDIGTVGVGEATIPQLQVFNKLLGVDETEFLKETQGTFKLGIQFVDWKSIGESYFHAFGDFGQDIDGVDFYHWWLKVKKQDPTLSMTDYTLSALAASECRFMRSIDAGNSPLSNIGYAYHFDAGLYAKYLRAKAESNGVQRIEGKVVSVPLGAGGYIQSVVLEGGHRVDGDFFIDCSGFRALLIEGALKVGYEDWEDYLPCNSAVTVASESTGELLPYTRSTAQAAGWQWRIPLQHRIGNGHVYCDKYMSDDEATETLLSNLDGRALGSPRMIKFRTGRRERFWEKNCLSLGLASGFMEPLESTSIHLVQYFLSKFFVFYPNKNFDEEDIAEFNEQASYQYEKIRDFLIAHYKVTSRADTEFWNYCRNMEIPTSLKKKLELFKKNGRIFRENNELFNPVSWFEVLYGQGLTPQAYHPMLDAFPYEMIASRVDNVKSVVRKCVDHMPLQSEYIMEHCKSNG